MLNSIISYKGTRIALVELRIVEQLIPHCEARDRVAQQKFYHIMKPVAYQICSRFLKRKESLISETIQNGLHKVLENLSSINDNKRFFYWFCNVITNECIDQLRKEKQSKSLFTNGLLELNESALDIKVEWYYEMDFEIKEQLNQLLIHQSPKQRKIFEMIYQGYNYLDMSNSLNMPIGTIKALVSRCRAEIRLSKSKIA